MRSSIVIVLLLLGSAAAVPAANTAALILDFTCTANYGASGSAGGLTGTCSGTAQPYGGATMTMSFNATLDKDGNVSGATGALNFTLLGTNTFVVSFGSTGVIKTPGGYTINGTGTIVSGTGFLDKASGTLSMKLMGVVLTPGNANVNVVGQGSITAPALPPGPAVPVGPGPLGDPVAANAASCGLPVTLSNGNMYHQFLDVRLEGRGFPISIQRTYNSQSAAVDSPFGFGWWHNYQSSIFDRGSTVLYVGASGGAFTFQAQSGGYVSASGLTDTLTKEAGGWTLRSSEGFVSRFDASGRLVSLTDRNGNTQNISYDAQGRIQQISQPGGASLTFSYDGSNHINALQDHTGRRTTYQYDSLGNLTSSSDTLDNQTAYFYFSEFVHTHQLRQVRFPGGGTIGFEYDVNNRVTRTTDQAGGRMSYAYGSNQTTLTDSRGQATTYYYNAAGNVTRILQSDGTVVDQSWNGAGRMLTRTDPAGYVTRFTYDASGRLLTRTDALGGVTSYGYDPASGKITSFTDPAGGTTRYEFDARGNLTRAIDPLGGRRSIAYDSAGLPLTQTDAEGRPVAIQYDAGGLPQQVQDAAGMLARLRFDNLRRVTSLFDAADQEIRIEYDLRDRVTKSTVPVLGSTTLSYDAAGNRASVTAPTGNSLGFRYDALRNLTEVTDPLGGVTRYEYQPAESATPVPGLLTSVRDARGNTTRLGYDAASRIVSAIDALGNATRYVWDERGDLAGLFEANGSTVLYEYDALRRRVRSVAFQGRPPRSFDERRRATRAIAYDSRGNVASVSSDGVTLSHVYDALGRLMSVTDSRGPYRVSYTHNAEGQRTSMTDPSGGVTRYTYDNAGRISQLVNPAGQSFTFSYGVNRRLSAVEFPNGLTAESTYDAASRLVRLDYKAGGVVRLGFAYTYDGDGNVATWLDSTGMHTYQYDKNRRLISAVHPSAPAETYAYDAAGNRTGSLADATYDAASRMLTYGATAYTYDNSGNVVTRRDSRGTTRFSHDPRGRLTAVTLPDGVAVAYRYDPLGRRIEKNVGGVVTRYVYDGDQVLFELDGAGQVVTRYTGHPLFDAALALERGGRTYYYLDDGGGNVAALADAAGAVVENYTYSAFGEVISASGGIANPLRFAAREFDAEMGLYYFRARYYEPSTGRFLEREPLRLDTVMARGSGSSVGSAVASAEAAGLLRSPAANHPYAYAFNNPLGFEDTGGQFGRVGAAIGDMINAIIHPVSAALPQPISTSGGGAGVQAGLAAGTGGPLSPVVTLVPGIVTSISTGDIVAATALLQAAAGEVQDTGSETVVVSGTVGGPAGGSSTGCSVPSGTSASSFDVLINRLDSLIAEQTTQAQKLAASDSPLDQLAAQKLMQDTTQLMNMLSDVMKKQEQTYIQIVQTVGR